MFGTWRRSSRSFAAAHSPRSWLLAITAVGLIGGGLATYLARDANWLTLTSVSHLALDADAAGILTATLVGLGFLLVALGMSLEPTFAILRSAGRLGSRAEWLMRTGFVVAGVAVILTGLFRIDSQASMLIHNVAGFASPIVLMATMVGAPLALRSPGRRFDGLSAVISATIVVLFALAYHDFVLPYALMELICFGLIGAWLWLFEAHLRRLIGDL